MKALTISQPYASLIADGFKFVENRKWRTNYRGWIAIHAGLGTQYLTRRELCDYPIGCIVGIAKLETIESLEDLQRLMAVSWSRPVGGRAVGEIIEHAYTEGPECWILGDRFKLDFHEKINCRGMQGLWTPPPLITRQLEELLAAKQLV